MNLRTSTCLKLEFVNLPAKGEMMKRRSGRSGVGSSFLSIMRGEYCAKKLRIPQKFMEHYSGEVENTATLITNSTACWRVGVSAIGNTICFKGGWENFFRDHLLGNDELLSFTYKGNMHFHVQIFDVDQCQRTVRDLHSHSPLNIPSPVSLESFTSSFPYFKICLKKSTFHPLFMLPIPKAAKMILNLPPENTHFIMRTRDRAWDVACLYIKASTQQQHRFSKGWRSFVEDNDLKPGDTCVFEIVATFELLVTIFRS